MPPAVPKVDPAPKKDPPPPVKVSEFRKPILLKGHQGGVYGLAVSRNAKWILSISDDRYVLRYSPGDADKPDSLFRLSAPGLAIALCNKDREAVFCDGGEAVVFDLTTGKSKATFENPRGGIRCLAAAADGSFVLTGTTDGCVRWWSVSGNNLAHTLDIDTKATVTALALTGDARWAAAGLSDGRICIWDMQKRRETKRWRADKGPVTALAYSADGKRLASAGEDSIANVWQPSGSLVHKLAGHEGPILGIGWCSDNKRVVTAGIDTSMRIWNENDRWRSERSRPLPGKVFSIAIDARDRFVLAGLSNGSIQLVPLPSSSSGD